MNYQKRTPEERFLAKITIDPETGCWLWTAALNKGYAQFSFNGKQVKGHRWSYEHYVGPIPEGKHLDHKCRTTRCVNFAHVHPVEPFENAMLSNNINFVTHRTNVCPRGHELTPANTVTDARRGRRRCRKCFNVAQSASHRRCEARRKQENITNNEAA